MIYCKEYQELANYLVEKHKMLPLIIEVKKVHRGNARRRTRKITIPQWVQTQIIDYQWSYVIHEVAHFIEHDKFGGKMGHSKRFKKIETKELHEFGLEPVYAKAYIKKLKDAAGQSIWTKEDLYIRRNKNDHNYIHIPG